MLQKIRDNAHGWWAYVVVPIIVLIFAFFGIGNYLTGNLSQGDIAKVNGDVISYGDFANLYAQINHTQNSQQNPQVANYIKIQVLQNLINQQLFYQALMGLGFAVGTDVIDGLIYQMPAFQVQGKFSMAAYQVALQNAGITTATLRDSLAKSYLVQQMQDGMVSSEFSLPQEVQYETALANLVRDVNYVSFNASSFANSVQVSDADVMAYYQAHQTQFLTPYQVKLAYVTLSASQFKTPGLDSDHAQAAFQNAVNTLSNQAFQNSNSLAPAAKVLNVSIQTTDLLNVANKAGILADPAVLSAVMSDAVLNGGQNSAVINLAQGQVMIVRVLDKQVPTLIPFNQVSAQIKAILVSQQELAMATGLAKQMQMRLNAGQDFSALASGNHLSVQAMAGLSSVTKNVDPNLKSAFIQAPEGQALLIPNANSVILFEVKRVYLPQNLSVHVTPQAVSSMWVQIEMASFLGHLQESARVKINDRLMRAN